MRNAAFAVVAVVLMAFAGSIGFFLGGLASDLDNYRRSSEDDEQLMRQIADDGPTELKTLEIDHISSGGATFLGELTSAQRADLEARVIDAFGRRAAEKVLSGIYVPPATQRANP